MRIQHNIPAMNSYRNYNTNVSAVNKNLEKLSSGYKINRAGDDAAGLAISEKMRAQISGLEAASKNVKDGISLVKTAEGAMQEVQDMLNRMVTLATQSANGTYADEVDRENLQAELDQLRSEINRIADSSNFNGIKLLDGSQAKTIETKGMTALVAGTDLEAIYDATPIKTPSKAEFTLNLHGYKFTVEDPDNISLTIGGVDLLLDADGNNIFDSTNTFKADGETDGDTLIQAIADNISSFSFTGADGKSYDFKVEVAESGILKFTSEENIGMDDLELTGSAGGDGYGVAIQGNDITDNGGADSDVDPDGSMKSNNGSGLGITVLNNGASDNGGVLATAKFTLTDFSDGAAVKIGDETYVFAVGANSKFAGMKNVVDLTAYSKSDVTSDIAAGALTKAAENNKAVKVEAALDGAGTMYLTEKEGGLDRTKWDVFGPDDDTSNDATWKNFVKTGSATVKGTGLTLQIGDTSDSFNQLNVNIGDIHTKALGIDGISVATQSGAQSSVDTIKNAINSVSSIRGTLGATQNRLEHTANNLSVMTENIQDAESTIRDTDIAEEMMSYTKNNILVQSAQAMLAQANQIPQGVLQLLG